MKKRVLRWTLYLAVLLLVLAVAFLLYLPQAYELIIVLQGSETECLEYGSDYHDPGVQLILAGKHSADRTVILDRAEITVDSNVQNDVLGIYQVHYRAHYWLWNADVSREVRVIDSQCPVIELVEADSQPLLPGQTYEEPGYKAYDDYDGDITHRVVRKELAGCISYAVTDSSGNPAYVLREIPDFDPVPPVITLTGEAHIVVPVGKQYQEPGYQALDEMDGDLTGEVTVSGQVDWLTPGSYVITYQVCDKSGNEAVLERTVEISALDWPDTQWPPEKTIYLTFDDGPGPYTEKLLDILDQYSIKATFFVVDSDYRHLMKEIVERGHSIGIHSVTHDYASVYAGPEAYFADLWEMQQIIYRETGVLTTLLRFPGGGSNLVSRNTCEGLMTVLTWAVRNAGFQYFDWNVDSLDAGGAVTAKAVFNNVIQGIQEAGTCIVLQHDIHGYSVDAVEQIILWGLENGYQFAPLLESSPGFQHDVLN